MVNITIAIGKNFNTLRILTDDLDKSARADCTTVLGEIYDRLVPLKELLKESL